MKKTEPENKESRIVGELYEQLRKAGAPLNIYSLRGRLQERGVVNFTEVGLVDDALRKDPRFRRWGRSDYWRLAEWGDAGVQLYTCITDKVEQMLEKATRKVHLSELAESIRAHEGIDECTPEQVRAALEFCVRSGLHQHRGWCWSGTADRFGAVTVSDAVRKCVSNATRLMTLEEICASVAANLPGTDVKKKTVSGVLARGEEFAQVHGAFWALVEWDGDKVAGLLDNTARGLHHVATENEVKNGLFRVRAEHLPFLPGEDSEVIIESPGRNSPSVCDYNRGNRYISGLGPLYRSEEVAPGDMLEFSVVSYEEFTDEPVFSIRKSPPEGPRARFRRRPAVPGRPLPPRSGLLEQGRMSRDSLTLAIEEGSRQAESLILLTSRFEADTALLLNWSERRVIAHAPLPLDRLVARCYLDLPEPADFRESAGRVLESTREEALEFYRLDERCGDCGDFLVATDLNFGWHRASAVCPKCASPLTRRSARARHQMTHGDLKRLSAAEGMKVRGWYPESVHGERTLDDFHTRRGIGSQTVLFRAIGEIEEERTRDLLTACFFEAVRGRSGLSFRSPYRTRFARGWETNPWMTFGSVSRQVERQLKWIREKDFYFYNPGSAGEVVKGGATLAWTDGLAGLPESSVDMAFVMVPFNGLVPVPGYQLIAAAWLNRRDELAAVIESFDLHTYLTDVAERVKEGGLLCLSVERDTGAFILYTKTDPVLRSLGFEFLKTFPETDVDSLADSDRLRFSGPEWIAYRKAGS